MTPVFVDTAYFVASLDLKDQWSELAVAARGRLAENVLLVTTDEVLSEVLASFSRTGRRGRELASEAVRQVLASGAMKVVPQSRESFLNGLARYESRLDKSYSLQDCISMNVMEAEGITEVLYQRPQLRAGRLHHPDETGRVGA